MTKQTILLVEDNPSDIDLTIRAFQKGHLANQVIVAEDGQDALDYIFGTGKYAGRDPLDFPGLTLLDLKLPKVSGIEVLRRVRADERTRRMPVVILTSSTEEQDRGAGYDFGVNSYIRKPVDFKEFQQVVEQLGLYWLATNEPPPHMK
jgi:two-component system response regulator